MSQPFLKLYNIAADVYYGLSGPKLLHSISNNADGIVKLREMVLKHWEKVRKFQEEVLKLWVDTPKFQETVWKLWDNGRKL
ncbi:hypothetical protein GCM10011379_56210 [Filimonas zeae]|uniref:Uncharacterized protein n=1 Tax=Filimonas zeae TaxID=1737353 RepID=A0A917J3N1_9BACT|nr:hypothetical protein GCM10011379_56210 [Filimonas zeae]